MQKPWRPQKQAKVNWGMPWARPGTTHQRSAGKGRGGRGWERGRREKQAGVHPGDPQGCRGPMRPLPALRVGPVTKWRSLTAPRVLVSVELSPASDWSRRAQGEGGLAAAASSPPTLGLPVPAPAAASSPHTCGWGQAACQLRVSSALCHRGHQASTGSSGPHSLAIQGRPSGALRAAPQPAPPDTWH